MKVGDKVEFPSLGKGAWLLGTVRGVVSEIRKVNGIRSVVIKAGDREFVAPANHARKC